MMRRSPLISALRLSALLAGLAFPSFGSAETALSGFKHDTSKPIEVTADKMEVRQDERSATFRGNVVAQQGELELKAEALKVYYSSSSARDAVAQIERIDAQGEVSVTSPAERARAEWGVYDVGRELITLGGRVVLSRGETVIRGSRLELNLKTGLSRMVSTTPSGGQDRVRGVFSPPKPESE